MRRRLRIILLVLAAAFAAPLAFHLAVEYSPLPSALNDPPSATPILLDIRDRPISSPGNTAARDAHPIPLREMGEWLPLVTVGIEDHRFWQHRGVDWHATAGAALRNLRNGRIISGASTITQQTVKILSGRQQRTLQAKVREALAAQKLEQLWSKRRILESYLNRLDYGNRRIGPEAAAKGYFGKSARDLTLAEAIFIAGLPQSPTRLNPWSNPQNALDRYRRNVLRLDRLGLLPSGVTGERLLAAPPRIERHDPPVAAPHFSALALRWTRARTGPIRTTLDLDLQRIAESLLAEHLRKAGPLGIGDAAIVVVDNATGEVRALASAGRPERRAINAANVPRSCGSTLKPFIYLSAIERRLLTSASLLPDTEQAIPAEYRDYDPQNYTRRFYGPVRLREALGNSINVPAVVAVSQVGAREAFNELRRWGFRFSGGFDDYGAGFVLGNADVRLVDLAGAYAGLARGGLAWCAKILRHEPIESVRIASPEACAIVTDILCDNNARRLSFGLSSPLNLGLRIAVKTGTSSGFRDRWCVGFSADHTVAVWAGNLDGQSLGEVLAVRAAAPLWASMMNYLLANGDRPVPEPRESDALHPLEVAAETGLVPRPNEPVLREWFLSGTEPTGQAATKYTRVDGRDALMLPPEYAAWCASAQNRLGAVTAGGELTIVFPRDRARFERNPHLPQSQQALRLAASISGCEWIVNGIPLQTPTPTLPLVPGEWIIRAVKDGKMAEARITVE